MARVKDITETSLFCLQNGDITEISQGQLKEVNEQAAEKDEEISQKIEAGEIDGLILVSADPENINNSVIEAAIEEEIPVVGTGGTSMSAVQSMGGNVVEASGTTGTTNRTRAVSYIASLSKYWELNYRPVIGNIKEASTTNWVANINLKSIMVTCLPAFIAMALMLALSKIPTLNFLKKDVFDTLVNGLPIVVAAIAVKKVSGLDETAILAGIITGVLSTDAGILGGILGGIIAGFLVTQLLSFSYKYRLPATTANIIAGGFSGLIAGLAMFYLFAPFTQFLGEGIRLVIESSINYSPILAGLVIWPALMGGFYHGAILPVILLEMEKQGNSFFGAVDMSGLVMVSAGITLANIIIPRKKGERAVAGSGFFINVAFGTFVEAAYPFMFSDKIALRRRK